MWIGGGWHHFGNGNRLLTYIPPQGRRPDMHCFLIRLQYRFYRGLSERCNAIAKNSIGDYPAPDLVAGLVEAELYWAKLTHPGITPQMFTLRTFNTGSRCSKDPDTEATLLVRCEIVHYSGRRPCHHGLVCSQGRRTWSHLLTRGDSPIIKHGLGLFELRVFSPGRRAQ